MREVRGGSTAQGATPSRVADRKAQMRRIRNVHGSRQAARNRKRTARGRHVPRPVSQTACRKHEAVDLFCLAAMLRLSALCFVRPTETQRLTDHDLKDAQYNAEQADQSRLPSSQQSKLKVLRRQHAECPNTTSTKKAEKRQRASCHQHERSNVWIHLFYVLSLGHSTTKQKATVPNGTVAFTKS